MPITELNQQAWVACHSCCMGAATAIPSQQAAQALLTASWHQEGSDAQPHPACLVGPQ